MKQKLCIGTLALCVLLGAARGADLCFYTDAATGFVTAGSIWLRYGLMALVLACAIAVPLGMEKEKTALRMDGARGVLLAPLAVAAEIYGFTAVIGAVTGNVAQTSVHHATAARMLQAQIFDGVRGILFVAFGVWCLLLFFVRKEEPAHGGTLFYLGLAGSAAYYVHAVVRFIQQPASIYRVQPAVEILSALAALLFVTALLRKMCLPDAPGGAGAVCRYGLLVFFFGTCLSLPQAVWQQLNGITSLVTLPLAATLGILGLLGAACAVKIAARQK